MKSQSTYALLLAGIFAAGPAPGSPAGEIDPGFGDHGRILLRETRFNELGGIDVFVDPASGKLLALASDSYGNDALLRFHDDGSLDSGFGDQGMVSLDFGNDRLSIGDVERLADGRLLIAGALNVYGTPDNALHGSAILARMHAGGTQDATFGSSGRAEFQLGGRYEFLSEMLLQPDGRIVVLGYSIRTGRNERILARFTQDGLLDTTFGSRATPGFSVIDAPGVEETVTAIVQQSDGKFMACGYVSATSAAATPNSLLAMRMLANGMPDPAFGNNGTVLIGGWQNPVEIHDCLEMADGHFVFVGNSGRGKLQRAAALRLTPDGRVDAGFGNNGIVTLLSDMPSAGSTMLLMTDGSLAIAGTHLMPVLDSSFSWTDMLVARIDPTSGEIDRSFGDRGVTIVDFGARGYRGFAGPAALNQQPDGKLLVIGSQIDRYDWWYSASVAMARIDPYGSGSNGWAGLIASFASVPRSGGEVSLHMRRTGGSTGSLSVDYRTVDDTASAGTDYVASNGTVVWADGDMSDKTISITVLNAELAANVESFTVEFFNSSGGLSMDLATIAISRPAPSGGPPPSGGGNGGGTNVGGSYVGSGAIGIELLLMMVLLAIGVIRRSTGPARSLRVAAQG